MVLVSLGELSGGLDLLTAVREPRLHALVEALHEVLHLPNLLQQAVCVRRRHIRSTEPRRLRLYT